MSKISYLYLLFYCSLTLSAKVLIITHSAARPDFIEMQYKTFKKFLLDDYEFVVFNDASNEQTMQQINNLCKQYGIKCFRVPQEIHTRPYLTREAGDNLQRADYRHANCIKYSFDILGYNHDGIVLLIDSDAFLIRPFSISKFMVDKDIAAPIRRGHYGVYYLSPIVCFFNMSQLPEKDLINFNSGHINGSVVDTGGWTNKYLLKHAELRIAKLNFTFCHQLFLEDNHLNKSADPVADDVKTAFYLNAGFNEKEIKFLLKKPSTFEFYLDNKFLHYRGGSTDHLKAIKKYQIFSDFINDILQCDTNELEQVIREPVSI